MQQNLTINFFRVSPDSDLLTILRRSLNSDEMCNPWETLQKLPIEDRLERYAVLSRSPFAGDKSHYTTHESRFDKLPRSTRVRLLDDGLIEHFRRNNLEIVQRKFSFSVFDKDARLSSPIDCLGLQRGVEFCQDDAFIGDRRVFGYFVNLKVSRLFNIGLENPALRSSAIGRFVFWGDEPNSQKGTLLEVNKNEAKVLLINGTSTVVNISSVKVPASNDILRKYLAESGQTIDMLKQILTREQQSALRLTPQGSKRRDGSRAQSDFVSSWLIKNSEYGRIRFAWPHSEHSISLHTTEHSPKRVEDF